MKNENESLDPTSKKDMQNFHKWNTLRNCPVYLPRIELKEKGLYLISARNAHVGVWLEKANGFIIPREKIGRWYLFIEYHWDMLVCPTAKPLKLLEEECSVPDSILAYEGKNIGNWNKENQKLLNKLKRKAKKYSLLDYYDNEFQQVKRNLMAMCTRIVITEDPFCQMLNITTQDGKELFHGNVWDFTRDADSFKKLFENMGIPVMVKEKAFGGMKGFGGHCKKQLKKLKSKIMERDNPPKKGKKRKDKGRK